MTVFHQWLVRTGSYLWLEGTGDSPREGKPWFPALNGVLLLTPPGLSLCDTVSGVWRLLAVLGLEVPLLPVNPFHCWPRCVIISSPLWSMPIFISSNFWMDLATDRISHSTEVMLYFLNLMNIWLTCWERSPWGCVALHPAASPLPPAASAGKAASAAASAPDVAARGDAAYDTPVCAL